MGPRALSALLALNVTLAAYGQQKIQVEVYSPPKGSQALDEHQVGLLNTLIAELDPSFRKTLRNVALLAICYNYDYPLQDVTLTEKMRKPLQVCFEDSDPEMKLLAARALIKTRLAGPHVLDYVLSQLKSDNTRYRLLSAQALGYVAKEDRKRITPSLHEGLEDPDQFVKWWIITAFRKLSIDDEVSIDYLAKVLNDKSMHCKVAAAYALCDLNHGNLAAYSVLKEGLAQGHTDAAIAIGKHYKKLDYSALEYLCKGLAEAAPKWNVRLTCVRALKYLGKDAIPAVPHLRRLIENEKEISLIRCEAIQLIRQIDPEQITSNDLRVLQNISQGRVQSNSFVPEAARSVLQEINQASENKKRMP